MQCGLNRSFWESLLVRIKLVELTIEMRGPWQRCHVHINRISIPWLFGWAHLLGWGVM